MFPLKIALLAFLASFATFSYAKIPSESQSCPLPVPMAGNPKVLISDANILLEQALIPFYFITPTNATTDSFVPVINEVAEIVGGLVKALRSSSLDSCDCTREDILVLTATTFKVILEPLLLAFSSDPGLSLCLPLLVARLGELINVVLALIGGVVTELAVLLIRNGSAAAILGLNLGGLIALLGLGGSIINALGHLGLFGRRS